MTVSWLALSDVKTFLRIPDTFTGDDAELQSVIDGAAAAIEDIKGSVAEKTVTDEPHTVARKGYVFTNEHPVAQIGTVDQLPGNGTRETIPQRDDLNGVDGWELISEGGVLTVPAPIGSRVLVTYQAGKVTVPANYVLAGKEFVAHLWRTSQMNAEGGRASDGGEDTEWIRGSSGSSYALPFKVRELLGIFGTVVKPVMTA